jgi:phenylacetate-coenzyme A ligase PaaK-like adenylate-forming protein
LERAKSLDFDPRTDVHTFADLGLFANVANELRDVGARDLIPKGYGPHPDIVGAFESGGTTGVPKKVVLLREWWDRALGWIVADLDAHELPGPVNWLAVAPSGPHMIGDYVRAMATARGGVMFPIDLDPRWVKKLIAAHKAAEAESYAEHLVDQAALVLQSQDIRILMCTPPLLERLSRRDDLVEVIRQRVRAIVWAGAHMDADTRDLFRTEVFPGVKLHGMYGSTMILGATGERPGLTDDDPCIFDPFSPYITFSVVDPDTGAPVAYGDRGQVVMHHVSKSFLLPNNLERDKATRFQPIARPSR